LWETRWPEKFKSFKASQDISLTEVVDKLVAGNRILLLLQKRLLQKAATRGPRQQGRVAAFYLDDNLKSMINTEKFSTKSHLSDETID
jgi:hypothetical protein